MALSVSSYLSSVSTSSSGYGFSSESRATPTFKLFRPSSLLVNTLPRRVTSRGSYSKNFSFSKSSSYSSRSRTTFSVVPRSSGSSSSGGSEDESKASDKTKACLRN
ncbi:hypothetical protein MKX03_035228 [Papaver bracteatum]|nr:hypothetical protein MKX03_035228 [Papaver bracteatum]